MPDLTSETTDEPRYFSPGLYHRRPCCGVPGTLGHTTSCKRRFTVGDHVEVRQGPEFWVGQTGVVIDTTDTPFNNTLIRYDHPRGPIDFGRSTEGWHSAASLELVGHAG